MKVYSIPILRAIHCYKYELLSNRTELPGTIDGKHPHPNTLTDKLKALHADSTIISRLSSYSQNCQL